MIKEFVVGSWYRIKTWDELIKEYPLSADPTRIDVPGSYYYTKEIEDLLNGESRLFQAKSTVSYSSFSNADWSISPQMCDPVGKEILEEIIGAL